MNGGIWLYYEIQIFGVLYFLSNLNGCSMIHLKAIVLKILKLNY